MSSYIERTDSCIVSLRLSNKERYTIEYKIEKRGPLVIQGRGKYNSNLPSRLENVLIELEKRISHTLREKIYSPPKVESTNLINNSINLISSSNTELEDILF